jgi:vanillin dehydrogenase
VTSITERGTDYLPAVTSITERGTDYLYRDIARAMQVARRIESGICHINGPTVHDEAQMPFGGVKSSGYGRFGSEASIAEFTDLRWITIQTGPRYYPI